MKNLKGITQSGEIVSLTGEFRNLGHGHQLEVVYQDGSKGFEHWEDIQFDDLGIFDFNIEDAYYYKVPGGFIEVSEGNNDNCNTFSKEASQVN